MNKLMICSTMLLLVGVAAAENLKGVDRMICSTAQAQICLETGECYSALPVDLDIPEFVVIDTRKNTISTTKSSDRNRSTSFNKVQNTDGVLYMQGIEGGRAFSFVIHETTGRMTVAVSRDGFSVTVFGVCTDSDI